MEPRTLEIKPKKLIGMSMQITMAEQSTKTPELWKKFRPRCQEIQNKLNSDFISMQIYAPDLKMENVNLQTQIEKWAAIEVSDYEQVPEGMQTYTLQGGLYAVFLYKGTASAFRQMFMHIFNTWLPKSEYTLDNREHFEILGEKYIPTDPDSEEDIYIPIKK